MKPTILAILVLACLSLSDEAPYHGFQWGYCTYFVAREFDKLTGEPKDPKAWHWRGNAGVWLKAASEKGFETATDPKKGVKGAIAVWSGGGFGHVAVVTGISATSLSASEMNWGPNADKDGKTDNFGKVTEANLPLSNLARGNKVKYAFEGYILPSMRPTAGLKPPIAAIPWRSIWEKTGDFDNDGITDRITAFIRSKTKETNWLLTEDADGQPIPPPAPDSPEPTDWGPSMIRLERFTKGVWVRTQDIAMPVDKNSEYGPTFIPKHTGSKVLESDDKSLLVPRFFKFGDTNLLFCPLCAAGGASTPPSVYLRVYVVKSGRLLLLGDAGGDPVVVDPANRRFLVSWYWYEAGKGSHAEPDSSGLQFAQYAYKDGVLKLSRKWTWRQKRGGSAKWPDPYKILGVKPPADHWGQSIGG